MADDEKPEKSGEDNSHPGEEDLSPDELAALEKIMAEIEQGQGPASGSPAGDAEQSPSDQEPDLTDEQQQALESIMAEIQQGQQNAGDDGADEADDPPAQDPPSDATQQQGGDDDLTDEQQQALESIMAEIEKGQQNAGDDDTQGADEPAPEKPSAQVTPAASPASADAAETEAPGSTLRPETIDPAGATAQDDPQQDDKSELTDEQQQAMARILAEIEKEDQQAAVQGASAPPDDHEETQTAAQDDMPDAAEAQPGPDATAGHEVPEAESVQHPQKSQGQADAAEAEAGPQTSKAPSFEPVYLNEVAPEPKKRKSGRKKPRIRARKLVWVCVTVTALAAAGTVAVGHLRLGWFVKPSPPAPASPPATMAKQSSPSPPLAQQAPTASPDSVPDGPSPVSAAPRQTAPSPPAVAGTPAPEPSPSFQAATDLENLDAQVAELRAKVAQKRNDLQQLVRYYESGVDEQRRRIADLVGNDVPRSLVEVKKNEKVMLALQAISRRRLYIQRLATPLRRLEEIDETLLHLQRRLVLVRTLAETVSNLPLDAFIRQAERQLAAQDGRLEQLSINESAAKPPALETVWRQTLSWMKSHRSTAAQGPTGVDRRIWEAICNGDFSSAAELEHLDAATARCLVKWQVKDLFLNRLRTLSPEAAQVLATWPGRWLSLNGLETLSPEAAAQLARWPGKRLSLNGLRRLSPKATEALAAWQGDHLELVGLEEIGHWDNYHTRLYLSEALRRKLELTP